MEKKSKLISTLKYLFAFLVFQNAIAQDAENKARSISGVVLNANTLEVVPFVNIAFYQASDSAFLGGAVSTANGGFTIGSVKPCDYFLKFSAVGFESKSLSVKVENSDVEDHTIGEVLLNEASSELEEVVIIGSQAKARSAVDKVVFEVMKEMANASHTGTDILKHVPGIQVDFARNISLDGSQNILILVNGIVRDRNYVQKLNASKIDRIEVMPNPPVKYEGSVSGAINIILHEHLNAGFEGQIFAEFPGSGSEIYAFPTYNLSYGIGKFNFYTAYNGEFAYFDITETYNRKIYSLSEANSLRSAQSLRQQNWSHRFHYGIDFLADKRNQLNLYGYHNPFSRELDGQVSLTSQESGFPEWIATREDVDKNFGASYGVYYKHQFGENAGHELSLDASYFRLRAENLTYFASEGIAWENIIKPAQNISNVRVDYTLPIRKKLKLATGLLTRDQVLYDRPPGGFRYTAQTYSAYGSIRYAFNKADIESGLRLENTRFGLSRGFRNEMLALLPNLAFQYMLGNGEKIKLNFRQSIVYPSFYQLNPYAVKEDPFTVRNGNPWLEPVRISSLNIETMHNFGGSWLSPRIFYQGQRNVINELSWINGNGEMESSTLHLGDIHQYGIQVSGSLALDSLFTVQGYLKGFNISTKLNDISSTYSLNNRNQLAYEVGISAIVLIRRSLFASLQFQYTSPAIQIQRSFFSAPLYFLSLEKSLPMGFKAGLATALPFSKKYTYRGNEITGPNFYQHSEGVISLSKIPLILRLNYQFSTGSNRRKVNRPKEELYTKPSKGF